jgi:hypothetical protein
MTTDGCVRLTVTELNSLRFIHRWSVYDEDVQAELRAAGIETISSGYTEWESPRDAGSVSIGWVWYETPGRRLDVAPRTVGAIGTNLMLIGATGHDLGRDIIDDFLRSHIAVMGWQQSVRSSLREH